MIDLDAQPEAVSREVAALVVKAIEVAGISQRRVADASNVATTSFHRKLGGDERYEITLTQLRRIAWSLGVLPSSFLPESFKTCSCQASGTEIGFTSASLGRDC